MASIVKALFIAGRAIFAIQPPSRNLGSKNITYIENLSTGATFWHVIFQRSIIFIFFFKVNFPTLETSTSAR